MDYRIFNVRTFLCVCVHTGVGHTGFHGMSCFWVSHSTLQKQYYYHYYHYYYYLLTATADDDILKQKQKAIVLEECFQEYNS